MDKRGIIFLVIIILILCSMSVLGASIASYTVCNDLCSENTCVGCICFMGQRCVQDSQICNGRAHCEYIDDDNDGYRRPPSTLCPQKDCPCARTAPYDCYDANSKIHPGATEVCNGIDDNCNGQIDEGDLDSTCPADSECVDIYCEAGVGCSSTPKKAVGASCGNSSLCNYNSCSGKCTRIGTRSNGVCNGLSIPVPRRVGNTCSYTLTLLGISWSQCVASNTEVCSGTCGSGTKCSNGNCVTTSADDGCCSLGNTKNCGVDRNNDGKIDVSDNIGICKIGTQTCDAAGNWGICAGAVGPELENTAEKCGDGLDNDCDGLINCDDSDCIAAGFCECGTPIINDDKCGFGNVCEGMCIPACTSDADCTGGEVCNIGTGHCSSSINIPTSCDEAANPGDCHSVGPFDCYWDEPNCNEINVDTSCSEMSNDQEACVYTDNVDCNWNSLNEVCDPASEIDDLGCPTEKYPQADKSCGDSIDDDANCNNNMICDPDEVCGCSDCVHQLGAGGCDMNNWCGDGSIGEFEGCILINEVNDEECETYGMLASACSEQGGKCANNYYLSQTPSLVSNGIVNIGEQKCCVGSCLFDDGYVINSVSGTTIVYSYGDCIPLETGSSEGTRAVFVNGGEQTSREECTILPSRRVPFSSVFGLLIGLAIIIGFYVFRKKY